jgi:hypothetical protein
MAAVLFDNPFIKEYSEGSGQSALIWSMDLQPPDANGVFRVVTIPGPIMLMGRGHLEGVEFEDAVPDPDYPQFFEKHDGFFSYRGCGFGIVQGNFCKVLQIKPGVTEVKQDFLLERERRIVLGVVKIQDAEGRPLLGIDAWGTANRIDGDSCTIYTQENAPPSFLILHKVKQKLAATLTLKAGEKPPPIVKLRPMGSVKGRLLDADGKPLAGSVVSPSYREKTANRIDSTIHEATPIASDANGVFTLDSLIPEVPFELSFRRGRRSFQHVAKPAEPAIQVNPGDCRDLGTIQLKLAPERRNE